MTSRTIAKYDRVQIILHWLIAVIVLVMIALGLYMVQLPTKAELPVNQESVRAFYFLIHKSLGMTVAILILFRVFWRLTHKAPPLPDTVKESHKKAASVVHGLLYVVMIAMPITGYIQSMLSSYDTKFWGIVLPRLAEADSVLRKNFTETHKILAFIFIALIIVHIAAAIKHYIDKTDLNKRMSLK